MDSDLYLEDNVSKKPALDLLQNMGYTYLTSEECTLQRGGKYQVLLKGILRNQLRKINRFEFGGIEQEFSSANIERAMEDLDEPLTDGLIKTSEKIYDAIMLGKSYQETVGVGKVLSFDLKYIDYITPRHIDIINQTIATKQYSMNTAVLNATDMSCFEDDTFDIVLNMGPFYHLLVEQMKEKQGVTEKLKAENQMLWGKDE